MSEEKKREAGPVVVRKGHVKPPPAGVKIETPVVEQLGAEEAPAAPAVEDNRPLWQRMADAKVKGTAVAASPSAPAAPSRPSQPDRGPRPPRSGGPTGTHGKSAPPGGPRRDGPPRDRREPRRDAGQIGRAHV